MNAATQRSVLVAAVLRVLPEGRPLPDAVWQGRHRFMLRLLWVQAFGLVCMALLAGFGPVHSVQEGLIPAGLAVFAGWNARSRRFRGSVCSLGMVATSATMVHISGGNIEMHFHFFVMVAVITLYQDWVPFLLAIGFTTLHHGVVGVIDPTAVYNHPDAWAHPWKWAAVHGGFVLAASAAGVVNWRLNEAARQMTDLVLNAAGEGIYVLDGEGRVTFLNPAAEAMLGPTAGLIGRPEPALLRLEEATESDTPASAVLDGHSVRRSGSATFLGPDGVEFPVDFVATPLSVRGQLTGAVVAFSDTTQRYESEEAVRTSEARFRLLFASNPHPTWVYDIDSLRFLEVNDAAVEEYGYARAQFLDMRVSEIVSQEDLSLLAIERAGVPAEHVVGKSRHRRQSGALFPVALTSQRFDFAGRRAALVVAQDISERVRFEEELAHQALHDALTGLPNRALFADRLELAMARGSRRGSALAVLFLDLDGFKVINDSLGHSLGDELLVLVTTRLQDCLRSDDTLARFGGDEFLVLLEGLDGHATAVETGERLLAALRPPFVLMGREVFVTASIGISMRPPERRSLSADDLVREADIAMYQAKAAGKAQSVLFDRGMDPPAVERLELETALRRAVERDELVLHFQPEVDLGTGEVVGIEALVRWQHPERGLIAPADFIPMAEETGLIVPIGEWVLRAACEQGQRWQALRGGNPLMIGVNLSARQLLQASLVSDVAAILRETGLPPSCLRLEVTESSAMQDTERTIAALEALRALGVEIAIDDFGTGYSSLSYLRSLPVNVLKIDRSFVSALNDDDGARAIVQAIIAVAQTLSIGVTAEGIETADQRAQIAELLCNRGQGYFFARPVPASELEALLVGAEALPSVSRAA